MSEITKLRRAVEYIHENIEKSVALLEDAKFTSAECGWFTSERILGEYLDEMRGLKERLRDTLYVYNRAEEDDTEASC